MANALSVTRTARVRWWRRRRCSPALICVLVGPALVGLHLHWWLTANMAALPALPATWRRSWRRRDHLLVCAAAATAADAAAQDGEENQTADTSADADDDSFVVVDPGGDLTANGCASAAAVLAFATAAALGAVQEVLLQAEALVGREFGGAAGDYAG